MTNETANEERHREWAARTLKELNVCQCADCEKLLADRLTDLQAIIAAKLADLEAAPVYDTDDIADVLVRLYKDNEENATTSDLAIAMSNKLKEWLVDQIDFRVPVWNELCADIECGRKYAAVHKKYGEVITDRNMLLSLATEAIRLLEWSRNFVAITRTRHKDDKEAYHHWHEARETFIKSPAVAKIIEEQKEGGE